MKDFQKKALLILRELIIQAKILAGNSRDYNLYEVLDDIEYLPGIAVATFTDDTENEFDEYLIFICKKYSFYNVINKWNIIKHDN